jgi:hypothetical protein
MPAVWGAGQVTDCGRTVGAAAGNPGSVRRRAVRQLAMLATDAEDARELLACLGLSAVEGRDGTEKVA